MPNTEPCPFVTTGRERQHCTLERGHAGSHLDHDGGRLLTAEETDAVRARFDALSVEELQALMKDPAALHALAEEAAPDPIFQAQVEAATDAAMALADQRGSDSATTDPLAELRFAMLLLDAKRTEALATFLAKMLVDPQTGPLVAGAMSKARQVAKQEALTGRLEPLMKEAADHFMLAVPHWQSLHAEMLAGRAPLAAKLPSPPDLFAGLVMGAAAVRLAPTKFSSKEARVLTQPWEEFTGDKSHGAKAKGSTSGSGCSTLSLLGMAVIAVAAVRVLAG